MLGFAVGRWGIGGTIIKLSYKIKYKYKYKFKFKFKYKYIRHNKVTIRPKTGKNREKNPAGLGQGLKLTLLGF
jgi:hypothetical protein